MTTTDRSVVVADDHLFFRDLLASALAAAPGLECRGSADSADAGVATCLAVRPDVFVVDVEMPGASGLTAVRRVREALPSVAVVVLTSHQTPSVLVEAARSGAAAYVTKSSSLEDLLDVLRRVGPDTAMVPPQASAEDAERAAHVARRLGLTPRELTVLGLMARGLPDKNIAMTLNLSRHTCRGYIRNLYAVLQVNRRIDAVNKARRLHLVPDL